MVLIYYSLEIESAYLGIQIRDISILVTVRETVEVNTVV